MAPVGVQQIFHQDKEDGLAEVCSEIGIPYGLSTASSSSLEEVAKANGNGLDGFNSTGLKMTISLLLFSSAQRTTATRF
jgi:isopentenyl diphosphate isomerase/L-lactate dehydrogenase-like FMN-dependent dehydrogenase